MDHTLESEIELSVTVDVVFAFFSSAENLELITPPELRFRIVTPAPVQIRQGALIDYQLSLLGIPFRWQTKITRFEPPFTFTDEQIRGPFKVWVHTHTFEPARSGTIIRDQVRYRLPLFPFGELAYLMVRAQLKRIFEFRRQAVTELLVGRSTTRSD